MKKQTNKQTKTKQKTKTKTKQNKTKNKNQNKTKQKTKNKKQKTKTKTKTKKQFPQKLQNDCENGTILKRLVAKPRSTGQALGGGRVEALPLEI